MNMNWLSTAIRKQKMVKESPGTTKSLRSSWRITPELDESSHDSLWDVSKSHNRMIRVGIKTYENNSAAAATYIGLRLFKPDFESGQWYRQTHFSFTVEELTSFAACLGLGEKEAIEAAELSTNIPAEFNKTLDNVLSNTKMKIEQGGTIATFGKKSGRKHITKGTSSRPIHPMQLSKKRTSNQGSSKEVSKESTRIAVEIYTDQSTQNNQGFQEYRFLPGPELPPPKNQANDDDSMEDNVFSS